MSVRRLALGTVQFGLRYGVANVSGQVPPAEAARIVERARTAGLDTLQTAIGYGDSERRLGEIGVSGWRVITKVPGIPPGTPSVTTWLNESVAGSLSRLRLARLDTLLLHRGEDLLESSGKELHSGLRRLQEEGTIGRIGVSIYDPAELDALLPRFAIDHVQAPFNVVDRRLALSGWMGRLRDRGIELHARSVFLQGLLLMRRDRRPARFARWHPLWRRWDEWLEDRGVSGVRACIGFVLQYPEIERVLVGVDSAAQLEEILVAAEGGAAAAPADLVSEDAELVNPALWGAS